MSVTTGIDALAKVVADVAAGVRGAIANGSNLAGDLALLMPLFSDGPALLSDAGLILPEFQGLDSAGLADVGSQAVSILSAVEGAPASAVIQNDVKQVINILIAAYSMIKGPAA